MTDITIEKIHHHVEQIIGKDNVSSDKNYMKATLNSDNPHLILLVCARQNQIIIHLKGDGRTLDKPVSYSQKSLKRIKDAIDTQLKKHS